MHRRISSFTLALATAAPLLWAQPPGGTEIDHKGVACIIAGKFPKLVACFSSQFTGGKAWFHAQDDKAWYWVNKSDQPAPPETLQPNEACSVWVLPRPSRKLVKKHIEYYIEVGSSRTGEFDPIVVRRALECKKDAPVAGVSPTGPAGVFPSLAPGFMGGFPTAAVLTTVAVGGGVTAALLANGNEKAVTPPTAGPPPAAPPPPPPPPPPEAPSGSPLALSCQADPKSGEAPLKVSFAGFPSGGTGLYDFHWTFGDGDTSNGKQPSHTYTSPGSYDATLTVTSGDQVRKCSRGITVNPKPPANFSLTVGKTGAGSGTVTDDHGKINCGGDCTGTYVNGTQVGLTPTPAPGSAFGGWSGACTGMGSCVVTTDANKSVTARFDLAAPPKVVLDFTAFWESDAQGGSPVKLSEVSSAGFSTPFVNIDPPDMDCPASFVGTKCPNTYASGTVVTLTADWPGFSGTVDWGGACIGNNTGPCEPSTCTLTVGSNLTASVTFLFSGCGLQGDSASKNDLAWTFQLDAPGAIGQVVVDGQVALAESGRRAQQRARAREGNIVVEAQLVKADGKPGTWRFETADAGALEPGSLRVVRGEVALVTPTAIVFRLAGTAGEQVAFSYRVRR